MGGAAGHLQHLYENLGLTFGEIKEVIRVASEGRLEKASEKLDGMNLVFTYDVGEGRLKVARTGSDIKGGGMDAAGLAKKFFGRGNIEDAFNKAFKVLSDALGALPPKAQAQVFGPGGNRWYSMEIIYAPEPNTIVYDSNNIVFHGWPIFEVQDDGSVEQVEDDSGVDVLSSKIDQMQKAISVKDWRVRGPSLLNLKRLSDGSVTDRAIGAIDSAMAAAGVSDSDNVYDYLRVLMREEVKDLGLPHELESAVVERAVTAPGAPGVPELKRMASKDQQKAIADFVKESEGLLKGMVRPIEQAISDFAVEVLRGVSSTLIAQSDAEVTRLQAQVAKAIRAIEASGNEAAMAILQKEMVRLGKVDNVSAAMEGMVFFYKGQAYKFTGAFAPAHQILSLFKYGRKGIPKMDMGEAMLRRALGRLLNEGGGSFDDVNPVTLEDFKYAWTVLEADLEMLGCTDIEPIGSTGKKQVMGDIDLACRFEGGAPALFDAAASVFGKENVRKSGGSVVSIRYQADVPAFQVDLMVGDPKYVRWGRAGAATIQGHPDYSPVKGVGRNILLSIINRWVTARDFPGQQTELDRTRYAIDFDRGLFKTVQTKRNATPGKPALKNWKDVKRELVSDDPDEIVSLMFGKGTKASDLKSFDGVVRALRHSPELRSQAREILSMFATEMRALVAQNPRLLGDDPDSVLTYVDSLIS